MNRRYGYAEVLSALTRRSSSWLRCCLQLARRGERILPPTTTDRRCSLTRTEAPFGVNLARHGGRGSVPSLCTREKSRSGSEWCRLRDHRQTQDVSSRHRARQAAIEAWRVQYGASEPPDRLGARRFAPRSDTGRPVAIWSGLVSCRMGGQFTRHSGRTGPPRCRCPCSHPRDDERQDEQKSDGTVV